MTFVTDMIDSGTCHQAIFLDPAGNALDLHHIYARAMTQASLNEAEARYRRTSAIRRSGLCGRGTFQLRMSQPSGRRRCLT